ncbi:MAG: hypothetical protein AB2L12_16970 [Smithellaceae bacterium]
MQINKAKVSKIKGFLGGREADSLYDPALEACKTNNFVLFSIDHHCGSEEQQPGETYFDPDLLDRETGKYDNL